MFSSNEWIGWFKNWNEICDRKSIRPIILWYRRYVFRSQPNGCLSGVASGERQKRKKNNTRDSNVVPHRSTNLARSCLTSLSRREAVLSWLYGRSCYHGRYLYLWMCSLLQYIQPSIASPSALSCPSQINYAGITHNCRGGLLLLIITCAWSKLLLSWSAWSLAGARHSCNVLLVLVQHPFGCLSSMNIINRRLYDFYSQQQRYKQ